MAMTALDSFLRIVEEVPPDSEFLVDMNAADAGVVHFKEAHVARDLVPLADDHLSGASRIRVVGYSGESVNQEHYRWTGDLMRWVALGNHVEYLLLQPGTDAVARLKREAGRLECAPGSFRLIVPDFEKVCKPEDSRLLAQWQQFHFVSFSNPRQLWVEKFHLAEVPARDCTYFSPLAAEHLVLWDLLTHQFEYVVNMYGQEIISIDESSMIEGKPELEMAH